MQFRKFFIVLVFVALLTIITQIGGMLFLVCYFCYRKSKLQLVSVFSLLYVLSTFVIVPIVAPYFGREQIKTNDGIKIHMFLTKLANRNYVVPQMNILLNQVSTDLRTTYSDIEIHCLDANFPFWDGFPLLPHLSHNDGKKLDISLLYQDHKGLVVNDKPSHSGYGIFEKPTLKEYNQTDVCKKKGYWQYDFPKYLTLGETNKNLIMSTASTRQLVLEILKRKDISKVFLEPHLRTRLSLAHPKLRYQGCRAVRHDDHIHLQVK